MRHRFNLKAALLAVAILMVQFSASLAQSPRLYVMPDSVSIGDIVTYTIVLPQGTTYESLIYPDSTAFGKDVEIVERKQFRTPAQADSIQFQLQFFGTSDLQLSGVSIGLVNAGEPNFVALPDVVIPFKTLLAEEEPQLRPMKDIYAFAINWVPYLLLLLLLVLIGWVLVRYMRRYLQSKPEQKPIEIEVFSNPLEQLEKKLLSLRSDASLIERDFKPFYTLLGDALREYLEEVHNLLALEMTTRELMRDMERRMVDPDLTKQTGVVLRLADMVKFAKFEPSIEQALDSIREAEKFLQIARMTDQRKVTELQRAFDQRQSEEIARREKEAQIAAGIQTDAEPENVTQAERKEVEP